MLIYPFLIFKYLVRFIVNLEKSFILLYLKNLIVGGSSASSKANRVTSIPINKGAQLECLLYS
jgi:hypothetical protein